MLSLVKKHVTHFWTELTSLEGTEDWFIIEINAYQIQIDEISCLSQNKDIRGVCLKYELFEN